MKFLFFASALAILSSASAHDAEEHQRRRISTGSAIHFSDQVDDALKLIVKGTNSKAVRSPIQQLIYNRDDGDKKDKEKNKDDEDKEDRKGGKSSSSSSNDKGRSSSSSSSSGDGGSTASDICNLGHNACDHDHEKKKCKGSDDPLATAIECAIACSTLCGHEDREHMGCPPLSSTSTVALKGTNYKADRSPIQQLIYNVEDKDDKEDSKSGSDDGKSSSSSGDRKSSSSSSSSKSGGSSSAEATSSICESDLDCVGAVGPEKLLCDAACDIDSVCTSKQKDDLGCPDDAVKYIKAPQSSSSSSSSDGCDDKDLDCSAPGPVGIRGGLSFEMKSDQAECNELCGDKSPCKPSEQAKLGCPGATPPGYALDAGKKQRDENCGNSDQCDSGCCYQIGTTKTCQPTGWCNSHEDSLTYVLKGQNYIKKAEEDDAEDSKASEDSKDDKNASNNSNKSSSSSASSKSSGGTSSTGGSADALSNDDICKVDCTPGPDRPVGCGELCKVCTDPQPVGCPPNPPSSDSLTYVLKGQNYIKKAEEDETEDSKASDDSKDDKSGNNKSSSSSSSSKSSGGTSSTGNSAASADGGGVCDVDCTPGPDRPVGCGELCKVCTDPLPVGCPPNPPSSDSLTYVLKGQNYIKKAEEDETEDSKASDDSKDDKSGNNKSSSSSSSSKSSGGTSSTGNSAASADGGGVCDVDCTPGPDRPVGCGELCKVCTDPLPVGCPPNPPSSFAVKNLRGLKND